MAYVFRCECTDRPYHPIIGMTAALYQEITLKHGVDFLIRAADCPCALREGQAVVEQTDTYKVVGPR